MGMLGKAIDSLPSHQKDRVIEAQEWTRGGFVARNDAKCLVGHAENWSYGYSVTMPGMWVLLAEEYDSTPPGMSTAFDRLTARFGMDRIVRAIKLRAGKPQPVLREVPQQNKLLHTNLTTVGG